MKLFAKQDVATGQELPRAWMATGNAGGRKYFMLCLPLPQLRQDILTYILTRNERQAWHIPVIVITTSESMPPAVTIDWGYTPYKEFMAREATR